MNRLVSGLALLVSLVASATEDPENPGFIMGSAFAFEEEVFKHPNLDWTSTVGFDPRFWSEGESERLQVVYGSLSTDAFDEIPAFAHEYPQLGRAVIRTRTDQPVTLGFGSAPVRFEGSLYFDAIIRMGAFYGGASEAPAIPNDCRLALYLQEEEENNPESANIYLVAGSLTGERTVHDLGRFYAYFYNNPTRRITVQFIDTIYKNGPVQPGFLLHLGRYHGTLADHSSRWTDTTGLKDWLVRYARNGQLFIPYGSQPSISAASFSGVFELGDHNLTRDDPYPFTISWDSNKLISVTLDSIPATADELRLGRCVRRGVPNGSVMMSFTATEDYCDQPKIYEISCRGGGTTSLEDYIIPRRATYAGQKYPGLIEACDAAIHDGVDATVTAYADNNTSDRVYGSRSHLITVDLNGKTFTDGGGNYALSVSGGRIKLVDSVGTARVVANGDYALYVSDDSADLEIAGGTFQGLCKFNYYYRYNPSSHTTISGGTFDGEIRTDTNSIVTVTGGRFLTDANHDIMDRVTTPAGRAVIHRDGERYMTVGTPTISAGNRYYSNTYDGQEYANRSSEDITITIRSSGSRSLLLTNDTSEITVDLHGFDNSGGMDIRRGAAVVVTDSVGGGKFSVPYVGFTVDGSYLEIRGGQFEPAIECRNGSSVYITGGRFNAAKNAGLARVADFPEGMTLVPDGDTGYLVLGPIPQDRAE